MCRLNILHSMYNEGKIMFPEPELSLREISSFKLTCGLFVITFVLIT